MQNLDLSLGRWFFWRLMVTTATLTAVTVVQADLTAEAKWSGDWQWQAGQKVQLTQSGSVVTGVFPIGEMEYQWHVNCPLSGARTCEGVFRLKVGESEASDSVILQLSPKGRWIFIQSNGRVTHSVQGFPYSPWVARSAEIMQHNGKPDDLLIQLNESSGAPLAGALVSLSGPVETGIETSDYRGWVEFPNLPHGVYQVSILETSDGPARQFEVSHVKPDSPEGAPEVHIHPVVFTMNNGNAIVASASKVSKEPCPSPLETCDSENVMETSTSIVANNPCPSPQEILAEEHDEGSHYRTNAADYERDAKGFRERATELRERAREWLKLSRSPRARGDTELFRQYEESARAMELQADRYDQQADEAESFAAEERRRYEERRRTGEESGMHSTSISSDCVDAGPRVAIDEPPPPSSTSAQPSPQEYVCGPDVTAHILRGLRNLYTKRWLFWDGNQRTNKCLELINPITGASAWEINVFAPSRGMDSRETYFDNNPTADEEDYEKFTRLNHWLQSYSPTCAIPKGICGPTVTFLDQCIHGQVVNYVLWGFMNKLCDQESLAGFWHSLWSMSANIKTYHGQKVMSEVGGGIAEEVDSAVSEGRANAEFEEMLNEIAKSKLESAMSNLDYYGFLFRHEDRCSLTCTLTPEKEEELRNDAWNMQWGAGASGNTQ